MNWLVLVSTLLFTVSFTQERRVAQWGLVFFGSCERSGNNEKQCAAKTSSEIFVSYIDPVTGVDFSLDRQLYGPSAVVNVTYTYSPTDNSSYTARGQATFGNNGSPTHTAVDFVYTSDDVDAVQDPENSEFHLSSAFTNVTGGYGNWANCSGFLTVSGDEGVDQQGEDHWNPFLFGNLLILVD